MSSVAPGRQARSLAAPEVYRLNVVESERMAEAHILENNRVELIDGYLVTKTTQKPPHVWAVESARDEIGRRLPPGWSIREEKPVRIAQFDEPEPDLAVVRGGRDDS